MNRRVMAQYREVDGLPDGLTVDARGHVWSAQWLGGRIIELAPDGTQVRHIPVPAANVTSLAFGGPDYRTLMITSATDGLSAEMLERYPQTGSVFEAEPGVTGLPEPLFKL
jgi:L-arabinonolactonase